MVERADWGHPTPPPKGAPEPEPASEPERPSFTREELMEFEAELGEAERAGELEPAPAEAGDAALDDEERKGIAEMRRLGMSDAEIARVKGIEADKVPPAEPEAPNLADVEAELKRIDQKRRDDFAGYRRDEALQARELELLETRNRLKAERSAAPSSDEVARIDQELAEIAKLRREDFQAYRKDSKLQARELELLRAKERLGNGVTSELPESVRDSWASAGGVDHHLAIAQGRTQEALGELRSGEAEALKSSFDNLAPDAADVITEHLGVEPVRRTADAATMARIAETEHGAGLSAHEVGTAKSVAETMLKSMSPEARADAERWAASLGPAEKRAAIRALGAKGARR